ncbi:MAG: pitrilysin family protein [Acidobacteriota bacterium]
MTRAPAARMFVAVVIASLCAVTLRAVSAPTVKFTETRLKNGLRVIISEDHAAPVFSVAVAYNVGSRDERRGRTGFAHLFEHMMFKGSDRVGAGEHLFTVISNGGTINGTTDKERTLYYETLPANQLDAALFLEADRMRSLAIVKDNLDNQRQAVQEERRLRVDNQPYGRADEAIEELAFDNFAYQHSVIGSLDDLNAASVEDVAAFFTTYYAPNNAVIAIVGDVTAASALERARQYFESIPSQPAPPPVDVSQPPQDKERRLAIEDPLARLPRIDIGYRVPSSLSSDDDAIAVLGQILASGRSSRLYEHVVREKQLAVSAQAFVPISRGPRLFGIEVTPAPGVSLDQVEQAIYSEIDGIKAGPIANSEMEKARNTAQRQFIRSLDSSLALARNLAEYALLFEHPGRINQRWDRLAKLSAGDVQRVAKQFLTPENRTVVVSHPKPPSSTANGGAR